MEGICSDIFLNWYHEIGGISMVIPMKTRRLPCETMATKNPDKKNDQLNIELYVVIGLTVKESF